MEWAKMVIVQAQSCFLFRSPIFQAKQSDLVIQKRGHSMRVYTNIFLYTSVYVDSKIIYRDDPALASLNVRWRLKSSDSTVRIEWISNPPSMCPCGTAAAGRSTVDFIISRNVLRGVLVHFLPQ